LRFTPYEPNALDGLDLAFCALPHGASQALMTDLRPRVGHVVDLAADFRLRDPAVYAKWYGADHQAAELLGEFVYGLRSCTATGSPVPPWWRHPAATPPRR